MRRQATRFSAAAGRDPPDRAALFVVPRGIGDPPAVGGVGGVGLDDIAVGEALRRAALKLFPLMARLPVCIEEQLRRNLHLHGLLSISWMELGLQ